MAILDDIDFEDGTTNEFSSIVGGDLLVSSAAAMAGTYFGLQITIAGVDSNYGVVNYADSNTGIYRARFYVDLNSLAMGNNEEFTLLYARSSAPATIFILSVIYNTASSEYRLLGDLIDDASGDHLTSVFVLTDAPHYIEVYVVKSSGTDDGSLEIFVDGVSVASVTGIDNDTKFSNNALTVWGAANTDANTNGVLYLDKLTINDDGSEIGPFINPANGGAVFGHNTVSNNESGISWKRFDDGTGGAITVSGDVNWGKGELAIGEEMRSPVYDMADDNPRTYTLTRNKYGTGSGTSTLQIRGQTAAFVQDDNVLAWTTYTVPILESWRYIQIREIKSS